MTQKAALILLLVFSLHLGVFGIPRSGKESLELQITTTADSSPQVVQKAGCFNLGLFTGSTITVQGNASVPKGSVLNLKLNVFKATCANFPNFDCNRCPPNGNIVADPYLLVATNELGNVSGLFRFNGSLTQYINKPAVCIGGSVQPASSPDDTEQTGKGSDSGNPDDTEKTGDSGDSTQPAQNNTPDTANSQNTGPSGSDSSVQTHPDGSSSKRDVPPEQKMIPKPSNVVVNITGDGGVYVVRLIAILTSPGSKKNRTAKIIWNPELKNPHGYLSAVDFPALVFYGVMTGVYAIYAIIWLIALGCNYTDLVRLQFWVLGVVLLGFLEKTLFLAEYDAVNQGRELHVLVILAVLVSAVKRALSRMLLVIVSMGYGTVRPRLGDSLSKVVGAGVVYCILATISGILRAKADTAVSNGTGYLLSTLLLVIVDMVIMFWIFSCIVETRRALRIRKNVVKLSAYNHFAYVLIFSIVAALGFMIWDLFAHTIPSNQCLTDWGEVWLHDCFWHVLFVIILGVIMIIWRPGANKKRFAYSLVDNEDAEEDDSVEQGANKNFESVKMRQVGSTSEPPPPSSQAEEDLRWVEENLPTSAIDRALPLILDSDEELMTSKFESSKMN